MAESLLVALAESLIGKLASVAVKEASLVLGVHKDLKDMSDYIALIKGVLLDAEQKTQKSNALIQWLKQVKLVISDAKDIVENFECEALRKQVVNTHGGVSRKSNFGLATNENDTRVEGSKVLVTTHIDTIASMMQPEPSHCYSLPGFSPKDSFSIFVKCAFEEGEEKKHPQLLEIGEEIVRKCKGIPLAVKTLGSSLFLKFDEESGSHFPVTAMWDTLGFLQPQRESETVNDVGNRYLRELYSRSFLTDFSDLDRSCHFKLHDLVRDLAIFIEEVPKGIRALISLHQLVITTKQADADFPEKEIANMISLETLEFYCCDNLELLFEEIQNLNLKSLLFSQGRSLRNFSFHILRSLESLVIVQCNMLDLSLGLGNQIPLSCLKLLILNSLPQLVTLPMWLQGSSNTLNTLVIMECFKLKHLPEWLSTMTSLRQLTIEYCPRLLTLPDNMHCLTNLESLIIKDRCGLLIRYHPPSGQDRHKISSSSQKRNSRITQPKDEGTY
ncbi:hypothetical protein VNO78_21337 [Psophocarpus tetragonolobus]|uniref:Rx N-terminal domain-containing protein n=1 Tax=Psophocarpus tetragonolobus TaxID=3891 RepID=A0AAN9XHK7_PSOTE